LKEKAHKSLSVLSNKLQRKGERSRTFYFFTLFFSFLF
jgi:hypothetical protein